MLSDGAPANEFEAVIWLSRWAAPHLCFPNVHYGVSEMDLAIVTKGARLLWEVEVKLSLSDWRADEHKRKWQMPQFRSKVARMYYAVPTRLLENVPPFVAPEVGLLALERGRVSTCRSARSRRGCEPVSSQQLISLFESTHYRFWRERQHRHRQILRTQRVRTEALSVAST